MSDSGSATKSDFEGVYMSDKSNPKRGVTRRQILKSVPVGIAAAAAVGFVSGRVASAFVRRKRMPNLPEDSIFAPDRNRYPEA